MANTIRIEMPAGAGPVARAAGEMMKARIEERSGAKVAGPKAPADLVIRLVVEDRIGTEGFEIRDGEKGAVLVVGNDERGLLYGVGKLLRISTFGPEGFEPGAWRGRGVPQKEVRGIYFATHFHNFYHDAQIEEVERYVRELALWGINSVQVWYDMHHFSGIDDPNARKMIARLHRILKAAKEIGMDAGLCTLGNEAYASSPEALRAQPTGRAHYGVEVCPYEPGGLEQILRYFEDEFKAFADLEIDTLWIWPYDQGGCGCEKCRPWGANGLLYIGKAVSGLFREYFPAGKVVLSTWLFDFKENGGEWEGLAKAFEEGSDWADYILADSHTTFPRFPIEQGVPGGLPMLNFPEISMWGMYPWGGYGANPLPQRFQALWDSVGDKLSGGWPYSEGIFEDLNKVVISRFYWNQDTKADEAVREYAAYEYGPEVVEDVAQAVAILEANHRRFKVQEQRRFPIDAHADAEACWRLIEGADARMAPAAREAWRWRILYLRALIDRELLANDGVPTARCDEAFGELVRIYHAQSAQHCCHPPTKPDGA